MKSAVENKISVLGLGNLMRMDDAAGMVALEALRHHPRLPQDVDLVAGETLGLDLLYHFEHTTHLLVLDAVDVGEAPGTIVRFRDEEVATIPCGTSVHLLGLADLLSAMRLLDCAPEEVLVLGVQPENVGWGTELTNTVQGTISRVVDLALEQIFAWIGPKLVQEKRHRKTG